MKNFSLLLIIILLLCQCSKFGVDNTNENTLNIAKSSEAFGIAVASDIHDIAISLHKAGVDYSDADASQEFQSRYYNDLSNICGPLTKSPSLMVNNEMSLSGFVAAYKLLTKKQLYYINRIIDETSTSRSYTDMMSRLILIADDIIIDVPEVQQVRLQNIIAVLYYGAKEMLYLESNGLIVPTPQTSVTRIKTKSEYDGATCRKFLETVWTIAVGEPTPTGEIVAAVATVLVGAVWYYEVLTCKYGSHISREDFEYCQKRFENCYSTIPDGCSKCLEYCLAQKQWPPYSTHKCE